MKKILIVFTLLFSIQSLAVPIVLTIENPTKIAALLSSYPALLNQIFAQGAAFQFSPVVTEVHAVFKESSNNTCAISLTAALATAPIEVGAEPEPAPEGVSSPQQTYFEEGSCLPIIDSPLYEI